MYAFDSVAVNAGRLRNSVTVTAEGASESVSVELDNDVEEADAAAAPVEAGEEEEVEEDVEEVAVIQKDGQLVNCKKIGEAPNVETNMLSGINSLSLLSCRRCNGPANASFANPRALL